MDEDKHLITSAQFNPPPTKFGWPVHFATPNDPEKEEVESLPTPPWANILIAFVAGSLFALITWIA